MAAADTAPGGLAAADTAPADTAGEGRAAADIGPAARSPRGRRRVAAAGFPTGTRSTPGAGAKGTNAWRTCPTIPRRIGGERSFLRWYHATAGPFSARAPEPALAASRSPGGGAATVAIREALPR